MENGPGDDCRVSEQVKVARTRSGLYLGVDGWDGLDVKLFGCLLCCTDMGVACCTGESAAEYLVGLLELASSLFSLLRVSRYHACIHALLHTLHRVWS